MQCLHRTHLATRLFLSALLCAACPKVQPQLIEQPLPSDAPWVAFLKKHDLSPKPAPGWEKALLSYDLKTECPLTYEATLTSEVRNTTDQQASSLPKQQDALAIFQIEPTKEGALFSSSKSSLPFESAPGVWLDHFWVENVKVPLTVSSQQLQSNSAPRAPWIDLVNAPGASLFFPVLTGDSTNVGQRWKGNQESNTNPQLEPSQWMPWKTQEPTNFQLEGIYTIHGERIAVITAQWSKDGSWSKDAVSPFYQANESGLATYIWLADRGWPLLSEVFVKVDLRTQTLDQPDSFYSYTLLGRSSLVQSCAGLLLPDSH